MMSINELHSSVLNWNAGSSTFQSVEYRSLTNSTSWLQMADLGKDVQALSHRLHSSKLDYLGLVVAAGSFCREFSHQHKVEVEFIQSNIPRQIPKDTSLSLFRVLQEALQNAVKHSGVRQFKVDLRGTPEQIHLTICDLGSGFNPQSAMSHGGLGLISIAKGCNLWGRTVD